MNLIALREQRANTWNEMQSITRGAEDRQLTQEEINRWEALEAELSALTSQINVAERDAELRSTIEHVRERPIQLADGREFVMDAERRNAAFRSFLRGGMTALDPEERALLGDPSALPREARALAAGTASAGGYTVPQGFRQIIVETQKDFGGMRRAVGDAGVINTESGNDMPFPTNDDTGNAGAILAENTQVTEQDMTFGQKTLKAYVYTSKLVRVSFQLLNDSAFDIEAWLARKLGERIGRATNAHFTTGTGSAQPEGIAQSAAQGKVGLTGQTTSVIYDDLVDLVHSVDPAYRAQRDVAWMLHDLSLAKVRKLKDSQNRPLWEPSVQAGQPDTLLGYPVIPNNDVAQMAANAKSIFFGSWSSAYVIRDVVDVTLLRLTERYADYLQVGFLAFSRHDGLVQDTGAVKHYANSAT